MLEIIRKGRVECSVVPAKGGQQQLRIIVDNRYSHTFTPNRPESKMLKEMDLAGIQKEFDYGYFVFFEGVMVDWRPGNRHVFVQSDEAVAQLQEHIGFSMVNQGAFSRGTRGLFEGIRGRKTNGAIFGGDGDPFELEVPEFGTDKKFSGGEFSGNIVFNWSVFSDKVTTSMNVQRLVCENGMVGDAPFVTYTVPVVNKWRENLDIVNQILRPRITESMTRRLSEMTAQKASLHEVIRAHEIINKRLQSDSINEEDENHLMRMSHALNYDYHLGQVYKDRTFNDPTYAKRVESQLMQYDVFNILTEANSHYGRDTEMDAEANRLLNSLVFDGFKARSSGNFTLKPSDNANHETVFWAQK